MKKWPQRKINQTPCGESCHLLTKVDVRSEKVLTGELGTIKPSALPYITTQKIEKNPEKMPKIIIDRVPLSSWYLWELTKLQKVLPVLHCVCAHEMT